MKDTAHEGRTPGVYALPCKIFAVILSLVTVLVTIVTGIGIGLSAVYGIYEGVTDLELRRGVTEDYLYSTGYDIADLIRLDFDRDFVTDYLDSHPGLSYDITLEDGTVLYSNYKGSGTESSAVTGIDFDYSFRIYEGGSYDRLFSAADNQAPVSKPAVSDPVDSESTDSEPMDSEPADSEPDETVTDRDSATESATESSAPVLIHIRLWGNQDVLTGRHLVFYRVLSFLNHYPITVMVVCLSALLASVLLILYLLCAAGHHRGERTVRESPFDRIPSDLFTAGIILLELAIAALFLDIAVPELYDVVSFFAFLTLLLYIPFYLLLIGYFMSLATRIKSGRLLKNTLIWIILSRIGRLFRWIGRCLRDFIRAVPLVQKTVLWVSILFWGNLILGFLLFIGSTGVLFWLLVLVECLVLGGVAIRYALSLRRLQSGAHKIASGELDHQVDTAHMPHDCRTSAEDLNHIGAGLSKAVDERLKSERFKTELITNVSHDIKTPLTSIINYVDLIKKSEPEDPTLRSYVEILDRQSNRLKKLIEDLVEASKASSGVLPVTLTPCALGVLLEQVEGEYAEKLAARELTLVVTKPADTLTIQADQRHLGRIFDNLMNNILKYAQPGTRVYLDASPDGEGQAVITFRNTSGAPLNIPAEELMERFVRGDASRHTEGSGLGLSIVQSLTELQGGHMHLTIDGDLFKVRLVFPAAATRPAFTVQEGAPDSAPSVGQNQGNR